VTAEQARRLLVSETGMLLERLGRSPGDMDYLYFEYEQAG